MPLTRVCMWSEQGWKHVTAREATVIHPNGTVSAKSGLFMCELCGQYVTLTDGSVRDRYFKHSAKELSKDCPERTFATLAATTFRAGVHSLPLRLKILSSTKFELQLGLIPVPEPILESKAEQQIHITSSEGRDNNVYTYSMSRIQQGVITYFSVGNMPFSNYNLSITPENKKLVSYWPQSIEGVSSNGSLFDGISGKKLPDDADTVVNHPYYLLTQKPFYNRYHGIVSEQICRCYINYSAWYIYEIIATSFDENAARFFLDYHCRLTENAITILPVWPIYVDTPYMIHHYNIKMAILLRGDAEPKVFPETKIQSYQCRDGKVFFVNCKERQQLLSAGRTKVLRYTYFWRDNFAAQTQLPIISVKDVNGVDILPGEQNKLPPRKSFIITAPFDGHIEIKKNERIINKYIIVAEQNIFVENLQMGVVVDVYQGLDVIWSIRYTPKNKSISCKDKELYNKLMSCSGERILIPHSVGALAIKMDNYPFTKQWFSLQIRKGTISERAARVLFAYFS